MDWLKLVHGTTAPAAATSFRPGDEVRVWYRIIEQGKERLGQFEGIVIRCRGSGPSKTFTVRRVTYGEGVERVFPMDAQTISRIEVLRRGHVKRSRLYYLRSVIGKTRIAAADLQGGTATPGGAVPVIDATAKDSLAPERTEAAVASADQATGSPKPRV